MLGNEYNPAGVGVREGLQQRGVNEGENCHVGSNTEGQGQYGDSSKAGIFDQDTPCIANILQRVFQPTPSPHVATLLSQNKVVSESPPRGIVRIFRRHSRFDLLPLPQFAV